MTHRPRIVVVTGNQQQRELLCQWLRMAGYDVEMATGFLEARQTLEMSEPDLMVADVRLEAYNGLHLAIWSRCRCLATRTILIGEPDPVLQKDAEREGAVYLSPPLDEQRFLTVVSETLTPRSARRSPRKRVTLGAVIDGLDVSIVELSYEGTRLEIPDADGLILPEYFTLLVPSYDVACRMQRVWLDRPQGPRRVLRCGAMVPAPDRAPLWRQLVDTAAKESTLDGEPVA